MFILVVVFWSCVFFFWILIKCFVNLFIFCRDKCWIFFIESCFFFCNCVDVFFSVVDVLVKYWFLLLIYLVILFNNFFIFWWMNFGVILFKVEKGKWVSCFQKKSFFWFFFYFLIFCNFIFNCLCFDIFLFFFLIY